MNYGVVVSEVIDRKVEREQRGRRGVKGGKEKKKKRKSIGSVSINLASGGLIAALNWVNRIVYLRAMIP